MEESDLLYNERRECGSPLSPERILDRKIERLALHEGFASNLAKRGPLSGRKASDRSVRSIVRLFEESVGAPESPVSNRLVLVSGASDRVGARDGKEGRRVTHTSNQCSNTPTKRPENPRQQENQSLSVTYSMFPSVRVGYQVEDYSLTLLRHKSYFNNRPLARCLDDIAGKDLKNEDQRVKGKKEGGKKQDKENGETQRVRDGRERKGNGATLPNQRNTSSPLQQLDNLMSDLLIWKDVPEPEALKLERRGSPEVKGFWSEVRTQLWVDEGEIYNRERPMSTAQLGIDDGTLMSSGSAAQFPTSCFANPETEHSPPPPPTRPPPPIPAAVRGRSRSAISSQWDQHSMAHSLEPFPDPESDYLAWGKPRPTSSVRLSMSAPGCPDIADLLFDMQIEPEPPSLTEPARPLPIPPTQPSHSRYPSSGGSGPWTRPPMWRSPSSLESSSPPPVPPLPVPIPTPTSCRHHSRANHSRHRHPPHSSEPSASTFTSVSTNSAAVTNSSGRSIHSRRTPATSTSSIATRSTRADSGTDLSSSCRPPQPRRRLTTEEKLSEIDAFLSPEREDKDREGWI
ncbi:uncharacterized protein B0H64DRAFT_34715 [Chaetomium fimeti]|uniref:Uncharacterized protein n=1 Tax=Chaetomium fimeti TaxID=1854472 RepID=A0AAE0HRA4_9PEZI|nr:hypothetical protein B0H64DRAFT_34715 [Chaetomium fimeti]